MSPPGVLHRVEAATHLFPGRAPEAATQVARAVEEILQTFGTRERDASSA